MQGVEGVWVANQGGQGVQRQGKRDDVLVIKASSDSAPLALIAPHLWASNRHWPQAREGMLLRAFYFHFPPICMSFISFSCPIALTGTSVMMLKVWLRRGHPCLAPDLSGKALNLSPKV